MRLKFQVTVSEIRIQVRVGFLVSCEAASEDEIPAEGGPTGKDFR